MQLKYPGFIESQWRLAETRNLGRSVVFGQQTRKDYTCPTTECRMRGQMLNLILTSSIFGKRLFSWYAKLCV